MFATEFAVFPSEVLFPLHQVAMLTVFARATYARRYNEAGWNLHELELRPLLLRRIKSNPSLHCEKKLLFRRSEPWLKVSSLSSSTTTTKLLRGRASP
ncbi:hypothetical protein Bca4012_083996 [Brassica carinata]|uniref:Uncharacterized protein n=1 Tax=Brassica carinata TaxID=52824 RepID=A0A8X7SH61_BRACI|nr:hypothetical protein Bca52824_026791 [Brassica carinata]